MDIRKSFGKFALRKVSNVQARWSPLHELVPEPPLRHGHAISIDMAYSATLSFLRGLLSAEDHMELLKLFSRAGLSMDHDQFDGPLLEKATAAIIRTRDGKLRAAVPVSPMGQCVFLNDVSQEEMMSALKQHKTMMQKFPRKGAGIDAFVDSSDTGVEEEDVEYTFQQLQVHDATNGDLVKQRDSLKKAQDVTAPKQVAIHNVGMAMDAPPESKRTAIVVEDGSSRN